MRALVAAAVAAWGGLFAFLAVQRHRSFESGRFDLGNMAQAVWSTAQGRPLEVTDLQGRQISRLGVHFDPILAAFAPLWRLWPSPELLLVVQAAALALGAVPVYALARRRLPAAASLLLALAYLLQPALQWLALADFHPVALATPLLIACLWALDGGRLGWFAAFAAVAVTTKEQVGVVVAALGLWYALARGRRRAGAAIAVAGLAVSAAAVLVVVPHFAPAGQSAFASRYGDPRLEWRDLSFLAQLVLPLAGLPLLAPLAALTAAPELLLDLASSVPTQTSIRYQYTAAAIPGLVAAAVLAAARFRHGALAALAAGIVATALLGPHRWYARDAHDRAAAAALAVVPPQAAVSATNSLGAHLSARRRVLSFPYVATAGWIAVDERRPSLGDRLGRGAGAIRALRRRPGWRVVFDRDGVLVLQRDGLGEQVDAERE